MSIHVVLNLNHLTGILIDKRVTLPIFLISKLDDLLVWRKYPFPYIGESIEIESRIKLTLLLNYVG